LSKPNDIVTVPVIQGQVLGVNVYRGYARLRDLADMSQADIYDPKTNPTGTQRDLSPKHAKDAYDYVTSKDLGFWPEVFLCTRNSSVIAYESIGTPNNFGILKVDLSKIRAARPKIAISRVDGNHRLHYADGATEGYPPVEKLSSFCLAIGLTMDEEITLFRDINNNQRRMSTSHLDNVEVRLSGEELLKRQAPYLYIAKRLGDDTESPFQGRLYDGGKKAAQSLIPLRTLKTGIEYMFARPTKLTALPDIEAKYKIVRNYFNAVKKWVPEAWVDPKKYLVLRGAGLWGICFLGAEIIDQALGRGQYSVESMVKILKSGRNWDWTSEGAFQGFSGRGGASKIRDLIVAELADESGASIKELYSKIMSDGN